MGIMQSARSSLPKPIQLPNSVAARCRLSWVMATILGSAVVPEV